MLQETESKCLNRLTRALIFEGFYTEVLVPLEGLSSGASQRRLFRYYLVIVSMSVAYPITVSELVVFLSV